MLVVRRKRGQTILVGDIAFKVVRVRGGMVTVGITAPEEVMIERDDAKNKQPRERAPKLEPAA